MKTLYVLTLEPIEQRYTKQWYKYFKEEFGKYFNVKYIDGKTVSNKIEKGAFLDINQTNMWKGYQIYKMGELFHNKEIKEGDRFLFADGWHPGVTALKYMIQLNDMDDVKMFGYYHAGSWDKYDFISQKGLGDWVCLNEMGWMEALDGIFVATRFHQRMIYDYFQTIPLYKIKVVGFPMDWKKEIKSKITKRKIDKENIVVFPHRLDDEKQPKIFDTLAKKLPQYKFIKTLEVTKNKKEYYNLLNKAKIVFSANLQETFGIGTVEAMFLDCVPIVPNRLCYIELYNPVFRYNTLKECVQKIIHIMENKSYNECWDNKLQNNKDNIVEKSLNSIKMMSEVMVK